MTMLNMHTVATTIMCVEICNKCQTQSHDGHIQLTVEHFALLNAMSNLQPALQTNNLQNAKCHIQSEQRKLKHGMDDSF